MTSTPFQIKGYTRADKGIVISGPGDLQFLVDYDDVDQSQVRTDLRKMVDVLNAIWFDWEG